MHMQIFHPPPPLQVLIHCNLNYIQGVGYEDEEELLLQEDSEPTAVSNDAPHDPSYLNQQPTADGGTAAAGYEMAQSVTSHVGFVDSPEIVTFERQSDTDMPVEPTTSWSESRACCVCVCSQMQDFHSSELSWSCTILYNYTCTYKLQICMDI